ncbi:Protein PNS1 [Paramyrothecium foliicola]|nr:Protein PNS1 [Paramyrothecium foliicola]
MDGAVLFTSALPSIQSSFTIIANIRTRRCRERASRPSLLRQPTIMGEADKYFSPSQPGGYNQNGYDNSQYSRPPPPPPPPEQAYGGNYDNQNYNQQYQQQPGYNGGYQQNYNAGYQQPDEYPLQQQAPPQYSYTPAQPVGDEKYSFDQAFKIEKPKYNDLWAAILFIVAVGGFTAISALALWSYSRTRNVNGGGIYDGDNNFSLSTNTILLFVFCLVVAFVLSYAYVWLARLFPRQFIWVTGILNIIWALGTAIYYLYIRIYPAGIVFLIFGVFLAFCFWTWISRIPFSALMLKTSVDVSKKYGHVYLVSLLGGIVATALAAWFSVTLVAVYTRWEPSANNPSCANGGCSNAKVIGFIVYITFAMYWISEWLKNTIHTTISGVYGSWYFLPHNFPKDATRGALKRALTYSFGSIAFGSLIVAIIRFLRQICSVARSQSASEGGIAGMAGYVLFCILGCFIAILEWIAEFVNRYAFSHIALYGKAYIPAAKDTFRMIKNRGFDALINECLIGPVLSFGAIFIAYACTLLAYLYLRFTDPPYNSDGSYTTVILAFAFLIGFQIANVFTTPLSSGIDTIFVAMAWDPQVMWRDHPELYNEMVRVYPKVQEAIPRN